jgi:hypothetical protein
MKIVRVISGYKDPVSSAFSAPQRYVTKKPRLPSDAYGGGELQRIRGL